MMNFGILKPYTSMSLIQPQTNRLLLEYYQAIGYRFMNEAPLYSFSKL